MSKGVKGPDQRRTQERYQAELARAAEERRRRLRIALAVGALVVVVAAAAALVGLKFAEAGPGNGGQPSGEAPADVLHRVATVPQSAFDAVGLGSVAALPRAISGPTLTSGGKPLVLYIGAEYCPFCATERWPMVVALSRFGTFSGLGVTYSSSRDVYPRTATFSFHGAGYSSPYLAFTGKEIASNRVIAGHYAPLDRLDEHEQALEEHYDAPPYTSRADAGSIPFIDFGNRYLVIGASYDPGVLQGLSLHEIASRLADPSTPVARGVLGTANVLTAALCRLTSGRPQDVCRSAGVRAAAARLGG